jgi:hypothetical protein
MEVVVMVISIDSATGLTEAKDTKITELRDACRDFIFAGFDSSALGTIHHYPLSVTDQANLQLAVSEAIINQSDAAWTTDVQALALGETEPAYKPHTAAQIMQVTVDISAGKKAALGKLADLIGQVKAATDIQTVEGIVW